VFPRHPNGSQLWKKTAYLRPLLVIVF